jgi:Threonyl-tRNA synthetase
LRYPQSLEPEGTGRPLGFQDERQDQGSPGQKIPYMLVVGQKEMDEKTLSLRMRDGRQENGLTVDAFIARVKDLVEKKSLEL